MSFLSSVTSGRQIGAQIHVIAGHNGVGKTTWAASFPQVVILDLEDGSAHLDVERISSASIPDLTAFRGVLAELLEMKHKYLNIAIDSVEALEGLIMDAVCKEGNVDSIEEYEGGYGKGYVRVREIMREIMHDLIKLKAKGVTTILVAHTQVKAHTDPASNQTYDRVIMRANDKMAALIRDLADNVFYATYKVFTTKDGNKTRAFGDGQRVMYTQWRPGFDAKNRLDLPLEVSLSYEAFIEECTNKSEANVDVLVEEIQAMSETLDDKMKAAVADQLKKFKGNSAKLKQVKDRLMKYVA
jgi:hypothetical protein